MQPIPDRDIHLGGTALYGDSQPVSGETVILDDEPYYCIRRYDQMPPFFMSIVSSADHWLFVASTGGLTAGRVNAKSALFPYYTEDKLAENSANTGPVTYLLVDRGAHTQLWQPFASAPLGIYRLERNLYKNVTGNKLIFEEINHDLGLTYRYAWRTSDRFGFVRTTRLQNNWDQPCTVHLVDGIQNLLPYGATTALQGSMSNLLNAYKRNELEPTTGLGLFTLSATLTDRAEPSESLKATTAWQVGLADVQTLLSTTQIPAFLRGQPLLQETDIKGQRGAYLLHAELELVGHAVQQWSIVADVNQDHSQVVALLNQLRGDPAALASALEADIARGANDLVALVAAADGLQLTAAPLTTAHHFANVLFNIMRGGIFADNDRVSKPDLMGFVRVRNQEVLATHAAFFAALPDALPIAELYARAATVGAPDLIRLCYEYLPLTFSRRHGDPSRPWNRFSINLKRADGSRRLDYQGNWRDIFQNWEPLAWSYPMFVEGMIARFLNATTADGYNPYRLTRDGVEWEAPEPDNPWANIGYWSDHQIIYLQKLLEVATCVHPGAVQSLLDQRIFSHADVPYRIRPYAQVVADPYNTIDFDASQERTVAERVLELGNDGKLVVDDAGHVFHVTLAEKLLLLLLVKLTNLVPEGGIWMNTQRPEWNDANNALVGKGLSVVTAAYLRRTIVFCQTLFAAAEAPITLTREVQDLLAAVLATLAHHAPTLATGFDDVQRRTVMDALGTAGSDYRWNFYRAGYSGALAPVTQETVQELLALALAFVDQTLRANRRGDGLYHAYNTLHLGENTATVDSLYEMLEGQVAVLSSGLLDSREALALLQSLRESRLYRADQHSYILYPDRDLPGFLVKNHLPADRLHGLSLPACLAERKDRSLLIRDENGDFHFNGAFRNGQGVAEALQRLRRDEALTELVDAEGPMLLSLFEEIFHHRAFTGRSGTFFAYEGLGSIYWHMVAKLLLATQECFWQAVATDAELTTRQGLAAAYYDIRAGIGFNKSPADYGAFPTDPYSHTPKGQGAKQPGMTGQVKEEILTRLGELGVRVVDGCITFDPILLRREELIVEPAHFAYVGLDGEARHVSLPGNALAFTFCQTPIVLVRAPQAAIDVAFAEGHTQGFAGHALDRTLSARILRRDGSIQCLTVFTPLV